MLCLPEIRSPRAELHRVASLAYLGHVIDFKMMYKTNKNLFLRAF
jgi:hypothetical protein